MTDFLKSNVEKLIEIEKQEEKYKTLISDLKKEKESLSHNIIHFMEKNKITDKDIIFGNSVIKYAQSKVPEGITKKRINERLTLFLNNGKTAKEATDFIYSDRDSKINTSIKILDKIDKIDKNK
jgi:seryl-tRNA synthetase